MRLKSSSGLRFGLIGAGVGVFGVLLMMIVVSAAKFSSAADGGLVSVATIDTALGFEMESGVFSVNTSSSSPTQSSPHSIAVYTNSSTGLSFKIGSTSNSLVYKNLNTVTDTFTAMPSSATLANIPAGTWGYAASTGSDCGTTFKGVPTTAADLIASSTFAAAGDYSVNLCIGTKGSVSKAAGSYAGQFTLSVTVNSAPVRYSVVYLDLDENGGASVLGTDTAFESSASHSFTLNNSYTKQGYTLTGWKLDNAGTTVAGGASVSVLSSAPTARYYAVWEAASLCGSTMAMQDITSSYISSMTTDAQVQMCDERDGKLYWVSKLADGNVWMTQNLDLDLSTSTALTSADSDVTSDWTPTLSTYTSTGTWNHSYHQSESYDPGDTQYLVMSGSTSNDTVYNSLSACTTAGNTEEVCQHGHSGNYYNWNAATAGSDASTMSRGDEASQSICPKGWRLPYGTRGRQSWYYLVNQASITATNITASPFYISRAGYYEGSVYSVGDNGTYWSSTAYGDEYIYNLFFYSSDVDPRYDDYSDSGYSVRCVARDLTMQTVADWGSDLDEGDSVQAVDERDGKKYWVTKLADGNVWMTQNLDLDITTAGLTNADTDLNSVTAWSSSSTYAPQATETTISSSSTDTDTRSWDLGDYVYDGTTNSSCGTSATSYADCINYGFSSATSLAAKAHQGTTM